MSIAQGTTHYDYPQVQLTDRPTFADFNPAFSDIDSKLYGLITGAATDEQAIADLGLAVSGLTNDLGGVSDVANAAKAKADANEEAIGLLGTQVSQNTTKLGTKIDSNAIAEPYDTAATYAVGDIVTYQGQRYRCTTAVAVAEPFDATKWTGEDVETVLEHLQDEIDNGGTAADVTLAPITGMTADDVQEGIEELKGLIPSSNDINVTIVTGNTKLMAKRYGNVVTLSLSVGATVSVGNEANIGTVSAGNRPAHTIGTAVVTNAGKTGYLRVYDNGNITLEPTANNWSADGGLVTITYVV